MKYINIIKWTTGSRLSKKEVEMLASQKPQSIPLNTQLPSHE